MINAGRVLIIPKGEWTNLESYEMLDLVTRGDIAYIARQASVGVDPATDTQLTYWQPFGTAAKIATTTIPGLVMPDGTTVTIDATGLISANIGISDINNVTITSISNGQILQYNSTSQKWENKNLGTAASRNATSAITSGSTDLIESGAVNSLKQTLEQSITDEVTARTNADALKADKTNLASISITGSTNNTGSKISKGTFFYKSGALARASVDIANGATLTQNTNYTLVTAGALNESLTVKTGTLTSSHIINTSYTDLRKSGNVVSLIFYITMSSNVAAYQTIATIPSEFRPPKNFYVANFLGDSAKAIGINADGVLNCAGSLSSGVTWRGQACWII